MTAEVAIMNRSAIALAADSAMTFGPPGSEKIYPVNKVFTLSKFHPVGIMIYNNADHMHVPFETIIKLYREDAWDKSEKHINDYAAKFLTFLSRQNFASADQIKLNITRIFSNVFFVVKDSALKKVRNEFEIKGRVPKCFPKRDK